MKAALWSICIIARQNFSHGDNVVSDGSPSRMRMVRRISLGMTTLPRSSILLTIPVAFIYFFLLFPYKSLPCYCLQSVAYYSAAITRQSRKHALQSGKNLEIDLFHFIIKTRQTPQCEASAFRTVLCYFSIPQPGSGRRCIAPNTLLFMSG